MGKEKVTIDNLPISTNEQYIKGLENANIDISTYSKPIADTLEIADHTPKYPSIETFNGLDKIRRSWSDRFPPENIAGVANIFSTDKLAESLGGNELIDQKIEKIESSSQPSLEQDKIINLLSFVKSGNRDAYHVFTRTKEFTKS